MPLPGDSILAGVHTLAELQGDPEARPHFPELRELQGDGKRRYATAKARVIEAAISLADCDSEDDVAYHRCWIRLRKTLIETGWTPPPQQDNEASASAG